MSERRAVDAAGEPIRRVYGDPEGIGVAMMIKDAEVERLREENAALRAVVDAAVLYSTLRREYYGNDDSVRIYDDELRGRLVEATSAFHTAVEGHVAALEEKR
jgi:hypothetical protein